MNLTEFKNRLSQNVGKKVLFMLPDERLIPLHFHITEVGYVRKDFIDCGGEARTLSSCLLQAWTAQDHDHSLGAGKLLSILKLSEKILPSEDLPVEVEFEAPYISQFPIISGEVEGGSIVFNLGVKHTDCLAKEKCGVEVKQTPTSCCSPSSGCC